MKGRYVDTFLHVRDFSSIRLVLRRIDVEYFPTLLRIIIYCFLHL